MKEYFNLQRKMLNRKLVDFGIPVWLAYLVCPLGFVLLSNYLFSKTELASYFYVFIAISITSTLSESRRNDFLKSIIIKKDYYKLRVYENLIISSPFFLFLSFKGFFLLSVVLVLLAIFMSVVNFNAKLEVTVPTPFGNKPFEYAVGFRKTFLLFPIMYILIFISITVGNYNLGVFALIVTVLTCCSFYFKSENELLVWNFNVNAQQFLVRKMVVAITYFTLLSIPIIVGLAISFIQFVHITALFYMLSCIYLITIIIEKYSTFPHEMSLPQGILITIGLFFPPSLLLIVPFLYVQSIRKLNFLLDDKN